VKAALAYVARRLAWAVVVVVGVTTIAFALAEVLPGDPARMLLGPQASAADVAHAREVYGLDRPLAERYARFWGRLVHRAGAATDDRRHASCAAIGLGLHVDLGQSPYFRKPVVELMKAKVPRSIELALAALAVQLGVGVAAGLAAAAMRGTRWDQAIVGATLVGISAPTFLLGLLLQYVFAYELHVLPYDGYGATSVEHAKSLVLPAATLGILGTALYARLVRDELATLLAQDFVRTAKAKGASPTRVLFVHAFRNALVPVATLAALDLGTLVGGAVVTEKLFRWPGVGQMAVEALLNRDGPVVTATVLFSSTAIVLATLALDVLYLALDPRLRIPAR
jgi:peptide/nickel transport system permease protein